QHVKIVQRRGQAIAIEIDDDRVGGDIDGAVAETDSQTTAEQHRQHRREREAEQSECEENHRDNKKMMRVDSMANRSGEYQREEISKRARADDETRVINRKVQRAGDFRQKWPGPSAINSYNQ